GLHSKPIGALNVHGFFDHLLAFCDQLVGDGFLPAASRAHLVLGTDAGALLDALKDALKDARGLVDRWGSGG
ncbi:MAG: LOG family protein, partial [Actinomycetota bacterium]|nr:LOG family protein [Actinomycetota bacterium]